MRPTPSEELQGVRRILADIVAPAVAGEYPATQLQQVLIAIERLISSLDTALPILNKENQALEQMFRQLHDILGGSTVADDLLNRVNRLLASRGVQDDLDFAATHGRNQRLRGLLAETITVLEESGNASGAAEGRELVRAAMRTNLDRALTPKED